MPTEWTPSTDTIREDFAWGGPRANPDDKALEMRGRRFDRWLAAHDAEVRAEASDATLLRQLDEMQESRADLRRQASDAHDRLVTEAAEMCWATDGRLSTGVGHAVEMIRRLRARAEAAEAKVRAVEALAAFWESAPMVPTINGPVTEHETWLYGASRIRAALADPTREAGA